MAQFLTIGQVAKVLGRSHNTVRTYGREGKLRVLRNYRGWRLFDPRDVERLRREIEKLEPENNDHRQNEEQ